MSELVIQKVANHSSNWFDINNPIIPADLKCFESDTGKIKIGNGISRYKDLPYIGLSIQPSEDVHKGLTLSCIDGTDITINPGNIELNGIIYSLTAPTTFTIESKTKSGDILTSKIAFVYTYINNGILDFVISSTAPLKDRYGNLKTSFDEVDLTLPLYHPDFTNHVRFIGYLSIQSDNTCIPFTYSDRTKFISTTYPFTANTQFKLLNDKRINKIRTAKFIPQVQSKINTKVFIDAIPSCSPSLATAYGGWWIWNDDNSFLIQVGKLGLSTETLWITSGNYRMYFEWI